MSDGSQTNYVQGGWDKEYNFSSPQMWAEFSGPGVSGGFIDYWSGWALNGTMRVLYYSTGSGGSWNVGVSDATGSANWQQTTSAIGMNYGTNLQAEGEVDEATNYIGGFGKTYAATLTSIQNYPTETSTGANPNLGSPLGSSNSNYKYCATQDGSLSTSSNLENYTVSAVGSC